MRKKFPRILPRRFHYLHPNSEVKGWVMEIVYPELQKTDREIRDDFKEVVEGLNQRYHASISKEESDVIVSYFLSLRAKDREAYENKVSGYVRASIEESWKIKRIVLRRKIKRLFKKYDGAACVELEDVLKLI